MIDWLDGLWSESSSFAAQLSAWEYKNHNPWSYVSMYFSLDSKVEGFNTTCGAAAVWNHPTTVWSSGLDLQHFFHSSDVVKTPLMLHWHWYQNSSALRFILLTIESVREFPTRPPIVNRLSSAMDLPSTLVPSDQSVNVRRCCFQALCYYLSVSLTHRDKGTPICRGVNTHQAGSHRSSHFRFTHREDLRCQN